MSIICTCGKASGPMCNGAKGCPLNATDGMPAPKAKANNTTNTLSAELQAEIRYKAGCHTQFCDEALREHCAYLAGATAYAPYKEKYEQAKAFLQKVIDENESWGALPYEFENEIKSFLDL